MNLIGVISLTKSQPEPFTPKRFRNSCFCVYLCNYNSCLSQEDASQQKNILNISSFKLEDSKFLWSTLTDKLCQLDKANARLKGTIIPLFLFVTSFILKNITRQTKPTTICSFTRTSRESLHQIYPLADFGQFWTSAE